MFLGHILCDSGVNGDRRLLGEGDLCALSLGCSRKAGKGQPPLPGMLTLCSCLWSCRWGRNGLVSLGAPGRGGVLRRCLETDALSPPPPALTLLCLGTLG